MKNLSKYLLFYILFGLIGFSAQADEVSREQIKGLDEQVQDIKKDVLAISSELLQLEEKLLYPSNTQLSVFLSFEKVDKFRLDAVKLRIDGKDVAHHIYSFKEIEALQSGGVQRLYTGNVRAGEHTLEVLTVVKGATQSNVSHKFVKSIEPKLVEISLSGTSSDRIGFKD